MGVRLAAPLGFALWIAATPARAEDSWFAPRDSAAPVLVGIGASGMLAGTIVESVGVGVSSCSGQNYDGCDARRTRLWLAGLTTVGVSASFIYAAGLGLWTKSLERPPPGAPTRRVDSALMGLGVGLTLVGTVAMVGGAYMSLFRGCDDIVGGECRYGVLGPLDGTIFAAGVGAFGLGLPLWMLYSHEVPTGAPAVQLGAGSAELRWSY